MQEKEAPLSQLTQYSTPLASHTDMGDSSSLRELFLADQKLVNGGSNGAVGWGGAVLPQEISSAHVPWFGRSRKAHRQRGGGGGGGGAHAAAANSAVVVGSSSVSSGSGGASASSSAAAAAAAASAASSLAAAAAQHRHHALPPTPQQHQQQPQQRQHAQQQFDAAVAAPFGLLADGVAAADAAAPGGEPALSVDDAAALIRRLPRGEPLPLARVLPALRRADSRAAALLLKDLAKAGHEARAAELFDALRALPERHPLRAL